MTPLDFPCPTCTAKVGEACHYGRSHPGVMTHSKRVVLVRKEAAGPAPYDVVYLGGLKYRVIEQPSFGEVLLRRGNSHTIHRVPRDELSYDAGAGMWRHTAKVGGS